jgi:PhnB protein
MGARERKTATGDEGELRRVIEDWSEALRRKDLERLWSHYASDEIRVFDLATPLQYRSEQREALAKWFETWEGPLGFELEDLAIAAGGDVAFGHALARLRGKRTDGETTDLWYRLTLCFRRTGGRWRLVHEHASVPFYMDGSLKAAIDLEP